MNAESAENENRVSSFHGFDRALKGVISLSQKDGNHGYFETPFLFRGQPDQNEIVSTLFRDKIDIIGIHSGAYEQAYQEEYSNICNWISRANKAGLQFNFDIWPYLNRTNRGRLEFVMGENHLVPHFPALSLSRHYGCKNRLIDFTKDRFAAFYFALFGAFEKIEMKLLSLSDGTGIILDRAREIFKEWMSQNEATVWVIREDVIKNSTVLYPDYGNNKFAWAQSAVFVLAPIKPDISTPTRDQPVFSKAFDEYGFLFEKKVSIPYLSIPHLLRDLEDRGINMIKYFPSPESIARNERFMDRVKIVRGIVLGTM